MSVPSVDAFASLLSVTLIYDISHNSAFFYVTYRGVDEAFVVHGQVEFGLDALDCHDTKPHGDKVEHG